jgi:dihydrofolate reductase
MSSVFKGKKITIVAAMARNLAIGMKGDMPWHLPGELKHFKETTMGKPIVMGRKTWESIGRVLSGRQNIVVTRSAPYRAPGCDVAGSLEEAVEVARGPEIMIIGGGQLYRQALALSDRMILTQVDCEPEADTWFPEWDETAWEQVCERSELPDERNPHAYRVVERVRKTDSCDTCPEPGTGPDPRA